MNIQYMLKVGIYEGEKMMRPRIFVSSTFYDLKSIREDLYQFIRGYNYEPIESETGDIGYVHGQELDKSCYNAMRECDMAILIIGGRYGSLTSEEREGGEIISITHKEFRTAVSAGIPVYAFIEQSIFTEYELYKRNKERFNNPDFEFEFTSVDSINIFKLELKNNSGIPIISFNKTQEIKEYLAIQWADMFKKYLQLLRESKNEEKTKDAIEEMSILVQKMNVMLDSVGKKILSVDDSKEYENVVEQQNIIAVSKKISQGIELSGISWQDSPEERKQIVSIMLETLTKSLLTDIWEKLGTSEGPMIREFFDYFSQNGVHLGSISLNMNREIKHVEKVLSNAKTRKLLESELIKDEYYEEMICHDVITEIEEIEEE